MEILTEFDELQEAMKKINMNESVMPYVNGVLCDDVRYNKVQKILNCPEMISAHKYLYNLDLDQLSEDESVKIDQLYDLGVDRGFIIDDLTKWDDQQTDATDNSVEQAETKATNQETPKNTLFKAKVPCWTIIYSAANQDGQIKTGEAYSNAISVDAAKADVKAKLSNYGYSNISILAIENCGDAEVKTSVAEDDMLKNRPHNNHISALGEADDEEASDDEDSSDSEDDTTDDSGDDEESDDDTSDDSSNDEESSDDDTDDADSDSKEDSGDDESDNEEDSDDEDSDDTSTEETSDDKNSDDEDSDKDSDKDSDDKDSDEDSDEDSDDEDSDEDSDDEEEKELDANEKSELKDKYKKAFNMCITVTKNDYFK